MKPRTIIAAILLAFTGILAGCAVQAGAAGEITSSMSYPLVFTDVLTAKGITKTQNPDGTKTYKAESVDHKTTIFGFERSVNYRDAEITLKEPKK